MLIKTTRRPPEGFSRTGRNTTLCMQPLSAWITYGRKLACCKPHSTLLLQLFHGIIHYNTIPFLGETRMHALLQVFHSVTLYFSRRYTYLSTWNVMPENWKLIWTASTVITRVTFVPNGEHVTYLIGQTESELAQNQLLKISLSVQSSNFECVNTRLPGVRKRDRTP
jgi:hypothetical protein